MPESNTKFAILELTVRNHPGTMSHITGMFARRAFNLEAIFVVPLPYGETSRVLLHMAEEPKLTQVEKQLAKLHDVLSIKHRTDLTPDIFQQLARAIP
jgi:acetolactate synthase-1/3 small subunit